MLCYHQYRTLSIDVTACVSGHSACHAGIWGSGDVAHLLLILAIAEASGQFYTLVTFPPKTEPQQSID